jgi:predicted regulator of Ras-like GTPase activity (Roadblock/LC7/MglB family)
MPIGYNAAPAATGTEGMRMTERDEATENLDRVLADLRALSGDIESCGVLSKEGELLSFSHAEGVDRERVRAMVAALANLAERVARDNGKEHASQVRVKTEGGHLLLVRMEGGGALAATTNPDARVGLVLYDMRNARDEVEKALEEGR